MFCGPNFGQNNLFYSNVIERPLKLACLPLILVIWHKAKKKKNASTNSEIWNTSGHGVYTKKCM